MLRLTTGNSRPINIDFMNMDLCHTKGVIEILKRWVRDVCLYLDGDKVITENINIRISSCHYDQCPLTCVNAVLPMGTNTQIFKLYSNYLKINDTYVVLL